MDNFTALIRIRKQEIWNSLKEIFSHSKLKIIVIFLGSIGFWLAMYILFSGGYKFMNRFPDIGIDWLTEYLFGLLFFALTLMLIISNTIISFSGLFKSKEIAFLLPYPINAQGLFYYKLTESIGFSSWAFLFLVTPLLFSYGINRHLSPAFYPLSFIFIIVYLTIPAGIGSIISLLIAHLFPRRKKEIIFSILVISAIIVFIIFSELAKIRSLALPFTARWMDELLGKFAFTQNPLLPSYWLVQGVMLSGKLDLARFLFFFLFIISQLLFLLLIIHFLSKKYYLSAYSRLQSSRRSRKYSGAGWVDWIIKPLTFLLSRPLKEIILKDAKSLVRDPVQWSQSLVFFGLLGVYFFNLRNLPHLAVSEAFWKHLVSFLNLLATSLTLATFTTRFIYPQLSIEGQKFWIIGLAPIKRKTIIYGKFLFSLIGSLIICESLILISNWMLQSHLHTIFMQMYAVFVICLGLSGLSVGLGAIYPNLKEDNPSKIVSGFGGTLTLVISMLFVVTIVIIQALPPQFYYFFRRLHPWRFQFWNIVTIAIIAFIGLIVAFIPLRMGLKAIEKMET